jgi:hypothetical protein
MNLVFKFLYSVGKKRQAAFKVRRYQTRSVMKRLGLQLRCPKKFKIITGSVAIENKTPTDCISLYA